MRTAKVTSKGRVTIPAELRIKFGIKQGIKINFVDEGDKIRLQPINKDYIRSQIGFMKTKGKLLKELMREKKKEMNYD
jgi:AbrB family looped-hinge helix DNA binding protein